MCLDRWTAPGQEGKSRMEEKEEEANVTNRPFPMKMARVVCKEKKINSVLSGNNAVSR